MGSNIEVTEDMLQRCIFIQHHFCMHFSMLLVSFATLGKIRSEGERSRSLTRPDMAKKVEASTEAVCQFLSSCYYYLLLIIYIIC